LSGGILSVTQLGGYMGSPRGYPALVVDGKVVVAGKAASVDEIKSLLR
jgi:hypothetical protein